MRMDAGHEQGQVDAKLAGGAENVGAGGGAVKGRIKRRCVCFARLCHAVYRDASLIRITPHRTLQKEYPGVLWGGVFFYAKGATLAHTGSYLYSVLQTHD